MNKSKEQPLLHTVRWTSAAIVAFGHALSLAFQRYPYDFAASPIRSIISYGADLGPAAVMLFFVISGYLVGGSVIERNNSFDLFTYWANRFSRIYIALVPALALTIGLDSAAWALDSHNPIYTTGWAPPIAHPIFQSYTPKNILATLLSLESFIGDPFGSDRPLWSLGYEWAFYFILPAVGMLIRRAPRSNVGLWVLGAIAISVPMIALHHIYMALFWMIWFAGALARQFARTVRTPAWVGMLGGGVALLAVLASPLADQRLTFPLIGIGFALFVACPQLLKYSLFGEWDRKLADMSYSLYIVHLPVVTFACFVLSRAGIYSTARYPLGWAGIALWIGLCALATMVAAIFGHLFEARTDELRAAILKLRRRNRMLA